ncbi:transposable element Tcb2 transposase [Trichonephila clavipes]|nr:transposable element Tcb2 transposase [Trichonephila clavipes]
MPNVSSAAIQAKVAHSLGASVSSRTVRRCLAEKRLRSRHPLTEWNQVVFSDESRFNLSSDDNCVRVWRPRREHLNPAFSLPRRTTPRAVVMFVSEMKVLIRDSCSERCGVMTSTTNWSDRTDSTIQPSANTTGLGASPSRVATSD